MNSVLDQRIERLTLWMRTWALWHQSARSSDAAEIRQATEGPAPRSSLGRLIRRRVSRTLSDTPSIDENTMHEIQRAYNAVDPGARRIIGIEYVSLAGKTQERKAAVLGISQSCYSRNLARAHSRILRRLDSVGVRV